ncbi:MAG TPA: YihY/virulence factor BrkB family protein, partial [Gemmatimonadetes bacterium]|nr:YihY/virulence factor BrkB family protein [Gemmatimonadota bacterium]
MASTAHGRAADHSGPRYHRPWYHILGFSRQFREKFIEDDVFFMAGAIAFNVLVSLVPLIVLVIGLSGYILSARFGDPTDAVLSLIAQILPQTGTIDFTEVLRITVSELVEQRTGFTLFGVLWFVWLSTRLVATLRVALRKIFGIRQYRRALWGKLIDVQAVIVGIFLLALNLSVTIVFEAVGVGILGLEGQSLSLAQRIFGHSLALASLWALFLGAYRYLPARRVSWRTACIAATFSALLHEAMKWAFSWYATDFAHYGSMLGNLATGTVLFFW